MKNLILLFFLLTLLGCDNPFKKDNRLKEPYGDLQPAVRERFDLYSRLSQEKIDSESSYGWPEESGDAFLWNCLARASGIGGDYAISITEEGRPLRKPDISPKDSKTPWSKDMEVGFLWCILSDPDKERALGILEKHIEYGRANNWDMCGPAEEYKINSVDRLSRCLISGRLQASLYRLVSSLGGHCGSTCKNEINNPLNADTTLDPEGFGRHLAIVHRYMRTKVTPRALNDLQVDALEKAAKEEPNNALYECVKARLKDGNIDRAAELLLDESVFPARRLPSKAEQCDWYRYQRDEHKEMEMVAGEDGCISYHNLSKMPVSECGLQPGQKLTKKVYNPDWLPCGSAEETRVPVDFLFAAKCVLGD